MHVLRLASLAVLCSGCAHAPTQAILPFHFEARLTEGEVRVAEVIVLGDPIVPSAEDWIGQVSEHRYAIRAERSREVEAVAEAVGRALPGEVNGALGPAWHGNFRNAHLPSTARHQLADALQYRRELEPTLSGAAKAMGGTVLFSWVDHLEAVPLSALGPPGSVVSTQAGLSVVDPADEPHLVSAQVGLALVAGDGEVVLRYQDSFVTILSGAWGPDDAGRDMARALAAEVAGVWALDPRLAVTSPHAASGDFAP